MSRIAFRRASFISLADLRSPGSTPPAALDSASSGSLHDGQRFAKPGLFGLSSNSSPHTTQVLIGNAISQLE
jgi:hypothetical protein